MAFEEAIHHAQLAFDQLDRTRMGMVWGSGMGGLQTLQEQISAFARGACFCVPNLDHLSFSGVSTGSFSF